MMKKRGRKGRLFLCFRPISVDDDLRPTKKLKLPTDSSGEEEGNYVCGEGIIKEKHCHRFSGALKSVMSDIFMVSVYIIPYMFIYNYNLLLFLLDVVIRKIMIIMQSFSFITVSINSSEYVMIDYVFGNT